MLQIYEVGLLPLVPNDDNTATLKLVYKSAQKQGVWQYRERDLSLVFEREEAIFTNTCPTGIKEIQKRGAAPLIACSEWVSNFGNWTLNSDCLYCYSGKDLKRTETERKTLYCSGFKFESVSGEWCCEWEYQHNYDFLNSSHEYNLKIQLRLNFMTLTGSYAEQHYKDVRG
ncbi:hypothetical protein [Anabaena catenula]|uniref:Uncharacterized protein n=1 Tax=Anabaena catenula FACHB-362 TaxID=2692877 RepID=A0ABR8J2R9_9NOST|nr:hypothetical protein [Anabaena catenula]MBD2691890.1 hypothetical protein [Anabaena catenula FACHB-362]